MSKKLFGKFFILLLVVGLLFAAAPTKQAQAQGPSVWDGNYPTDKPLDMPAVVGGVQEVTTAAQFAWLASQTTMFETGVTTVKLMVDIDLAEHPWTPSNALGGGATNTFDGNNHTISGLKVSVTNSTVGGFYYAAMFVGPKSAAIKNLTIDGANVLASSTVNNLGYAAVLTAGSNWYGLVENVTITNSVVGGTKYVAAIGAYGNNSFINCTVQGVTLNVTEKYKSNGIDRDLPHIGGLVGLDQETHQVYGNTINGLTINFTPVGTFPVVTDRIGGLIGTASTTLLVGANSVSDVMLNDAPYTKLIGLDQRTYKVVNATQMLGYTTIQAAIDAAADGDTIQVAAGTYEEAVDVTKAVTLLGPNAGVAGSGTRTAEAIIKGPASSWVSLYVEPNLTGVKIDGFKFDGSNLEPGSAYSVGLFGGSGSLTVQNNVFENHSDISIMTTGVYYESGWKYDKYLANVIIKDNLITNTTLSTNTYNFGIYLQSTLGSVTGNMVTNMRSGIQVQPYWNTPGGGVIEGNTFSAYRRGIWFNYSEHSTGDWLFKQNIVTGLPLPTGAIDEAWNGIRVETFSAGNVNFKENQVDFGTASSTQKYVYFENNVTGGTSSATPNWWGSAAGPEAGAFVGTAEYIPWCGEPACTSLVYPEFNGTVSGVLTKSGTGAVSGTLTGAYTLNVTGQVTGYVNNRATFTGTVTGDIVGDITATINDNGVDTLAGTITNAGAILPVRILGIFPQSGTTGDFEGQIITGTVPDLATSMSITPSDVSTVFAGGTLQLGVVIDPTTAAYGEWSIWEPTGTDTGSTISSTGLLTAGTPGTITVIAKALDGSLLDATKVITIEPALVSIAPVTPVVCGNTTTTTIDINVAGIPEATPLQGYQFRLNFDETKTNVANLGTDIVNGRFVLDGGFWVVSWIDETTGAITATPTGILDIAYTQYTPSASFGDGKLASITLTHLGVPGDIDFTLTNVVLSSRDGIVIPSEASATATTLTLSPAVLNTTVDPDAGYCDLASAVLAASAGDTLQLQADIAIPETVIIDKELTLDLNGKVASYTPPTGGGYALVVSGSGALTVNDTSNLGAIRAIGALGRGINVKEGGDLVVNGGAIQGEYASVYVRANSSMILNGGLIGGVNGAIEYSGIIVLGDGTTDSAILEVKGGEIVSYDFAISGNGGLDATTQAPLYSGTKITITAGTITSTGAKGEGIYHPQAGTLNISGGTITGHQGVEMRSGTLNLTGGTIHAIGNYVAVPDLKGGWSTDTGDAIYVGTSGAGYAGNVVVNISGTPIITSDNGFALREEVLDGVTFTNTQLINVTGGTFTGGTGTDEAGAAVKFDTVAPAILKLTGGLYNTDPANPIVYVFVPYGTIPEESMFRIVGISLNVTDFYYNNNGILRGVSTDFTVTNFVIADATSVTIELFSGADGAYVLQQTNTLKTPASFNVSTLTSSFDIFGTYVSNSWTNVRGDGVNEPPEYGQHVPPTRVLVTVVLPGGTLTGENLIPDFEYSLIQPSLIITDFGYFAESGVRGVSAGLGATNFKFNLATSIKVELFSGTTLLQTNTVPVGSHFFEGDFTAISGPFDIFGTFNYVTDGYWSNARESEYGQTLVPTKVVATVMLPGNVELTAEMLGPSGDRTIILPGVSGLVTLQGILAPKAGVGITLTSGTVVRTTLSTALSDINYGFTGVETLTYTFTTSQARYLNVTADSGKIFLVDRDRTLNPLRLFGGDVDQNNIIQVNDASLVGQAWGSTANPEGNINYDGIVNIQDLALVGGNYGLASATAYNWWSPLLP